MPRHQTPAQKETVERVMHEFKHGELETGQGRAVRNRKQAVAIALREAGESKYESPSENRKNLRRTKRRERQGGTGRSQRAAGPTREALYEEARRRDIPGRSKMTKDELRKALQH
jgi:hypothetical protein